MKTALRLACILLFLVAVPRAQGTGPVAAYSFSDGTVDGRFGPGMQFSGGAGVLLPLVGLSNAFTLEAWINPTVYQWSDLWTQMPDVQPANPMYWWSLTTQGGIYFSAYEQPPVTGYPMFTVQTVPLNTWTHVAVTYDGAQFRVYFNAVEVARRNAAGVGVASSQPMRLGADFHGRIDEVRAYARALTAGEIALDRATPIDSSTPLQISVVTPPDGSLGVSSTPITATFSAPVDPASITSSTFSLRDAMGAAVPASVTYDVASRTATLAPTIGLAPLSDYTARAGEGTAADRRWTFRTAADNTAPRAAFAFSDGGVVNDASGNGNVAVLLHGAHPAPGIFGGGIEFNGGASDVQIAASDTMSMLDAYSFEAWVKPFSYAWGDLWSRYPDNAATGLFYFSLTGRGTLFTSAALAGIDYPMFTDATLPLNAWTHVALTYDGARLRIYVDGFEVASRTAHGSLAPTPEPMEIGLGFHGVLDEVRIYDRALTAAEVLGDRQKPVDPAPSLFVTTTAPRDGAVGVLDETVSAVLSADVDVATLTAGTFELLDHAGAIVPSTIAYLASTKTVVLTPLGRLDPLAEYTARLMSSLAARGGSRLAESVAWSFRTAANVAAPSAAFAFSETTDTVVHDWSGNGNDAVLPAGVSHDVGWFDRGLFVPDTVGGIAVTPAQTAVLTTAFTLEGWVQVPGTGRPTLFVRSADDQAANPVVWLQEIGGVLDFNARLGGIDIPVRSGPVIPAGVWTHVAATYDGARIRLYVNGAEVTSRAATGGLLASNQPIGIGRWIGGRIDEVRLYRRALSAAEIAVDMATPVDTSHPPPAIAAIVPPSGVSGQLITINGSGFGPVQPSSIVTFSGHAAVIDSWTDSSIAAVVPPGVPSGPVVVTANGRVSNSMPFTLVVPPVISSLSPLTGPAGQPVTISGAHFGPSSAGGGVTFNGSVAAITSWSDSAIVVTVPAAATSGAVIVSVGGHQSNGVPFSVNGPRISATVSPLPNAAGWNSSSVTVTFACAATEVPVTFCTSPQTIAFSGAAIKVTGRAVDQNGVTATMTALVNVDLTGPVISVYSPKASAVFPPGTSNVRLKGSAVDVLSGVSVIACAGIPAVVVGQNFSCAVAVQDRTNTVAVVGVDVAGRTTTKNVSIVVADVAPVSLAVSPATFTMMAGDAQPLAIADERGRAVTGGAWTSTAPAVASVSVDAGVPTVHAFAAGTATLTFLRNGLSAQTFVSVLAEDAVPADGTTLWGLLASPNPQPLLTPGVREVIRAAPAPTGEAATPSLFFVERGPYFPNQTTTAVPTTVRAVAADGRELWTYALGGDTTFGGYRPVRQIVADDRGGIVMLEASSKPACCYQMNEVIRRIDGQTGEVSWEYTHPETFGRFSEIAFHPDGVVFVVEKLSNANTTELVGINAAAGTVVSRFDVSSGRSAYPAGTNTTSPLVQDDGSVTVVASHWDNVNLASAPKATYRVTVPSAAATAMTVDALTGGDGSSGSFGVGDIMSGPWPDGHGGLIIGGVSSQAVSGLANLVHIGADGIVSAVVDLPFGTQFARDLQYVLSDDAGYVLVQYWEGASTTGAKVYKIDTQTLALLGVFDLVGGPYVQLTSTIAGGGTLYTSHAQGDASQVGYSVLAGWVSNMPVVQKGQTSSTADTQWPMRRGVTNRHDASNPRIGIFVKAQPVTPPAPFLHTSIRVVPRDQARWAEKPSFRLSPFGEWYLTIGAESDPPGGCGGLLKSDVNRSSDLDPANFAYRERIQYPLMFEEAIVSGLLSADSHYHDDLFYSCFPMSLDDTYNSNSYTHGLLDKVGLSSPMTPFVLRYLHPGWRKPVPPAEFDPD